MAFFISIQRNRSVWIACHVQNTQLITLSYYEMKQDRDGTSKAVGFANIWDNLSLSLEDSESQIPRAYLLLKLMPQLNRLIRVCNHAQLIF